MRHWYRWADAEIVRLARSGQPTALEALLERHRPNALRLAAGMMGPDQRAGALVQEACEQASHSLEELRNDGCFGPWLYGLTLYACRCALQAHPQETPVGTILPGSSWERLLNLSAAEGGMALWAEQTLEGRVRTALGHLPPRERITTLLFYYTQLSRAELARLLGGYLRPVRTRGTNTTAPRLSTPWLRFLEAGGEERERMLITASCSVPEENGRISTEG